MADLVLGLAKSAVEGTLAVAKSAIEEEEKLKKNMQRDLLLISDEFEMMHAFLNVAKGSATDEMVSTLVRQVRNMALDAEDCIELVVLMDIKSHWWRRLLPYCILAALPAASLDDAVSAIEMLKSRVEAMGKRNERYMHIIGSTSATKPTDEKMHRRQAVADDASALGLGLLIEATNGKAKQAGSAADLIELINKSDDGALPLQVISLWGSAGNLGVASIIKKTYDDPRITKKFSLRAWVKLAHPFNPREFMRSLLAQFSASCCLQEGSAEDELMKQIKNQRYLVFLEDMPSAADWEAVRVHLPDNKKGSCMVVHTLQLEVAGLCVGQSHGVLKLEQFSADHSIFLFFKEAKKQGLPGDIIGLVKEDATKTPLRIISVCEEAPHINNVASIIEKTCNKEYTEICKKFKYRAMVKLMHPFSHQTFVSSLLAELCKNYCPQHGNTEDFLKLKGLMTITEGVVVMKEFVKQLMSNQRYLVLLLLEDMPSKDDLEATREFLPDKNNGSCIIVYYQPQQLEVARLCVRKLRQPSDDPSFGIFFDEIQPYMGTWKSVGRASDTGEGDGPPHGCGYYVVQKHNTWRMTNVPKH